MAALSTIALGALTGLGALSSYSAQKKQAAATMAQGGYDASLLEQNAGLADAQATDVLARGRDAELGFRGQTRQLVGTQRSALAGQGVDINQGSAAAVQAESNALGAFDALTIRNNAAREAWGFRTAADDDRRRADLARRGAQNMAGAQRAAAGNTLLTGATLLAGQARDWRK